MIHIEYTATLEPANTKSVMMYCERNGDDCSTGLVLADKDGTDRGVVHFTLPEYADLAATVIDMEKAVDPVFTLLYVKLGNEAEQPDPALTDGAGEQVATVPNDASILAVLQSMADGLVIWPNHPSFAQLLVAGFVGCESIPSAGPKWTITDAGRARLAAQTPEAESEEEEASLEPAELAILRKLVEGRHIFDDHKLWQSLYSKGLISALGNHYYTIADQGRAALAAQEG